MCSPNTCRGVFNPNVTTFQLSQIAARICNLVLFKKFILSNIFINYDNDDYKKGKMPINYFGVFAGGEVKITYP